MKLAVVLTLVKCLLLCARGLWAVSLHRAGGAFQRLLSPKRLLLVLVHMCWNRMQLLPGHIRYGVFPLIKMEAVLETRTKEDHGVLPLQKALLDTTPHLQGSLPCLKSLCWQSSVGSNPLTTYLAIPTVVCR